MGRGIISSMSSITEKPVRKRAPRRRVAQKHTSAIAKAKNSLSLVALSPYRLPVDPERLVLHTARISAIAFVFIAIVVSYKSFESIATNYMIDVVQTASVAAASVPVRTPNVSFEYAAYAEREHTISVRVPNADSVALYAFDPEAGEYQKLGDAVQVSKNIWEYPWDTSAVAPGRYWIKALVTNRYGMYDRSDSDYLVVE